MYSLVQSRTVLILSLHQSFIRSFIHSFTHSPIYSFRFSQSASQSVVLYKYVRSFIDSFLPFVHSFHSLIHFASVDLISCQFVPFTDIRLNAWSGNIQMCVYIHTHTYVDVHACARVNASLCSSREGTSVHSAMRM